MKQLVLFDIDGTLIYHVGTGVNVGFTRFEQATERVFGRRIPYDKSVNYNGWVDRQIAWENLRRAGVGKIEFNAKFPEIALYLHEFALRQEKTAEGKLYLPIESAVELVRLLDGRPDVCLGLLTGNVERVGRWKLSHSGVPDVFTFGLFGDEADDRPSLARLAITKANAFFRTEFMPEDITVIGDAVWDVRCARAIGASCIAVMTGGHTARETLGAEHPDILVDTLADRSVIEFFRRRIPGFPEKRS